MAVLITLSRLVRASCQYGVGPDSTKTALVGSRALVAASAARRDSQARAKASGPTRRSRPTLLHFGDERVRAGRLATDGRFVDASDSARTRVLAACEQTPRPKR
jgi:hypothetical protein